MLCHPKLGKIVIEKTRRIKKKHIQELEREHKKTNNENILKYLTHHRQTLNDLLTLKAEGALCFANQKYCESVNRASRLLRKARADCTVAKIVNLVTEKTLINTKDIAEAFSVYYETLYDSEETDNKTERINIILGKVKLPKLTDSKAMRDPITKRKLRKQLSAGSRWIPR